MKMPPPIRLESLHKSAGSDLGKARRPQETIASVQKRLAALDLDILAEARRVDNGRLGIPVYLGVCGADARAVLPTRKQMGKGASPEQAMASAMMELMERYAFFTFWRDMPDMAEAGWREAEKLFGGALVPVREMAASVLDNADEETAREILDLTSWRFYPATRLVDGAQVWLPLDWFKMLGEFNGSSAGNAPEESILQGLCELVERHVCCLAARRKTELATIDPASCHDPVLAGLIASFARAGVRLVLKDLSMGMPLPTVAALAWDPATFPARSEIVFTAGTASSPARAAIRAITEAAQLGGDFNSGSCYEASGLPKYQSLEDCAWVLEGPKTDLASLPCVENADIREELLAAAAGLAPIPVYAVETTNPQIGLPAHWCLAPGLEFRERDSNQSLGLFTGRKLAEEAPLPEAENGLERLERLCPGAHYIPFFRGLLELRKGEPAAAFGQFEKAAEIQPDAEAEALASFYAGYALGLAGEWRRALEPLAKAARLSPAMRDYASHLGVANYRLGNYAEAEKCFGAALDLDRGSAMDLANRGVCRALQGRGKEAAQDLAAALELDPSLDFARERLKSLETG